MLDKDIKSGLYQLGRTPYSLRHACISLKVNDEYVDSLDAIEQYVNLSTIEMRNNFLADLTPLRALLYLTSLNVSRNKLTEVLAFSPPRCENGAMHAPPPSPWAAGEDVGRAWATGDRHIGSLLRDADLSFNEIEEIRDVSEHRNLRTLVLDSNRIGALAMGQLSAGFPTLHTLHLSNNCLTKIRGSTGCRSRGSRSTKTRLRTSRRLTRCRGSSGSAARTTGSPRSTGRSAGHRPTPPLQQLDQ